MSSADLKISGHGTWRAGRSRLSHSNKPREGLVEKKNAGQACNDRQHRHSKAWEKVGPAWHIPLLCSLSMRGPQSASGFSTSTGRITRCSASHPLPSHATRDNPSVSEGCSRLRAPYMQLSLNILNSRWNQFHLPGRRSMVNEQTRAIKSAARYSRCAEIVRLH